MNGKLVGGPFDGASESLLRPDAPPEVRAWKCSNCGGVHITAPDETPPGRSVRYRLESHTDTMATYVYGDLNFSGDKEREKELVGA